MRSTLRRLPATNLHRGRAKISWVRLFWDRVAQPQAATRLSSRPGADRLRPRARRARVRASSHLAPSRVRIASVVPTPPGSSPPPPPLRPGVKCQAPVRPGPALRHQIRHRAGSPARLGSGGAEEYSPGLAVRSPGLAAPQFRRPGGRNLIPRGATRGLHPFRVREVGFLPRGSRRGLLMRAYSSTWAASRAR